MKILHVSTSDIRGGGACIAAYRLHSALHEAEIDSRMLVRTKASTDPFVLEVGADEVSFADVTDSSGMASEIRPPKVQCRWAIWGNRLAVRGRGWLGAKLLQALGMKGCSLNILPTGLQKVLNASDADIIHFHWPHGEMISIREIAKINKPLVWTLHDCWPFLGAEHHSSADYWMFNHESHEKENIDGINGFNVQRAKRFNPVSDVVNQYIFRLKQRAWKRLNVSFIAPSNWMAEQLRQSKLFTGASVTVIPNGLDLHVFQPLDRVECRDKFRLPQDKKLLLFGANNPLDPNKGCDLLEQALLAMTGRYGVELVVFGAAGSRNIAGLKTHWMGVISSEKEMAALYNTADGICVPSRKESFGQTASEALACGTPVLAFRTSGLMDIVDHKKNGYLAESFNIKSFSQGLKWILDADVGAESANRRSACRAKAEAKFSSYLASRKYASVYESIRVCARRDNFSKGDK